MQAVAISHRNVHNRFAVDAIQYQQTAAAQEALDIKKVRTQVKDCIMLAQAEVMHRAAVGKGNGFAIAQTFLVKTVEVQFGSLAGKKDAEVEHLAGVAIELGMGRHRAGVIEPAIEGALPQSFQRDGIQFPRQSLLSKGQQTFAEWINTDVDGRFQSIVDTIQAAALK